MELTKSESNILEILLDADKPLSKSEILNHALENKPWKDGSIHILLNSLLKRGLSMKQVSYVLEKDLDVLLRLQRKDGSTFQIY